MRVYCVYKTTCDGLFDIILLYSREYCVRIIQIQEALHVRSARHSAKIYCVILAFHMQIEHCVLDFIVYLQEL